jgi:hypothetical protein
MPHLSFDCFLSNDFMYTYVAPIANLGAMDTINAEFGALAQAAGPAYAELMKRGGAATDHIRESVMQHAPELSYQPAQPRLQPSEVKYRHYDLYYVLPGREPEADALGADYVKLFKAKGATTGYNVYKTVLGPDLPLILVSVAAKDPADYYTEDAKTEACSARKARPSRPGPAP